jgi:hypothetical protein
VYYNNSDDNSFLDYDNTELGGAYRSYMHECRCGRRYRIVQLSYSATVTLPHVGCWQRCCHMCWCAAAAAAADDVLAVCRLLRCGDEQAFKALKALRLEGVVQQLPVTCAQSL